MSTRQARVVVAYATVKVLDAASGKPTVVGFYKDGILPVNADPDNVESLVRRGYAEWVDDEPMAEPEPAKPADPEPKAEPPKKAAAPAKKAG